MELNGVEEVWSAWDRLSSQTPRRSRAFGPGAARQGSRGRRSRQGGVQVTVKEQQGWRMKHEWRG